jgi:hypothetical protein
MSKLGCRCGHVIADQTDALAYKAMIIPDQADEAVWGGIGAAAQSLMAAAAAGEILSWLRQHGFADGYPANLPPDQILSDFISSLLRQHTRIGYECTACGRLYLEMPGNPNHFIAYQPEDGQYAGALKGA